MKSICKKVNISPSFLFIILLSLLSGLFKDVITLFLIIIIHEMGHVFISLLYKWNIKKVDITICGGFITYDELIDKPFKEELLISLAGFLFQLIFFFIYLIFYNYNIIDNKLFFLMNKYNLSIFLFNILPIYPLDGSKIILVIFNLFFPYKKSLHLINLVSIIMIILIILCFFIFDLKFEYSYIMIISFIIFKIVSHIKLVPYLFNKFLFERYLYGSNCKSYEYVKDNNLSKFKRRKKHFFLIKNHYYNERFVLSKRFD